MRLLVGSRDVLAALAAAIERHGRTEVAAQAGVSKQFISLVTHRKKPPSGRLLAYLGYRKVVAYERIGEHT